MNRRLDYCRFAAAFMIVAIHTAPFGIINERIDYSITYCLFRVAVPFFLMVSGYYVVWDYWNGKKEKTDNYLCKLLVMYIGATLLYLPINLYAGKEIQGIGHLLKILLFDGTFYHLWYLPAAIMGCLLVKFFYWIWGIRGSGLLVLILYVIGTLGDSYYGLVSQTYIGRNFYNEIFRFSEYTRNGIFYAPMFLWLGAAVREMEAKPRIRKERICVAFIGSLFLMMAEGFWTYEKGWQIHNSMYFTLPPVMYFGFCLLVQRGKSDGGKGKENTLARFCKKTSLWIYLLHPLCIILVRGGAKVMGLTELLVNNSLIHYLLVCLVSIGMAVGIYLTGEWRRKRQGQRWLIKIGRGLN